MSILRTAGQATTGAVFSMLTPITALVLLVPTEYGKFSLVYLIFAFGVSIQFSTISDLWSRVGFRGQGTESQRSYAGALFDLSLLFGAAGGLTAFLIGGLQHVWWALGAAVVFTLLRSGSRYYAVAIGQTRRVVMSDGVGVLAFIVTLVSSFSLGPLFATCLSWFLSSLCSSLVLRLPSRRWGEGLLAWTHRHWRPMRPLLGDSLLMDAGAIGTPLILAGLMGPTNFGIYRAISNASMPVRLLIDPIRPRIGRMRPSRLLGIRGTAMVFGAALAMAVASYVALAVVVPQITVDLGTLTFLTPHALATAVFVAGSLIGTFYYIACRTTARAVELLSGRVAQTVLVFGLPLLGLLVNGLDGAIWGFGVSSFLSALVWFLLARRSAHRAE